MPRALLSRGQKNLLPKCYSILTIPLLDSHHGVTRYPRATALKPLIDELTDSDLGESEAADERRGLVGAVEIYRVENPKQTLGGLTLQEFMTRNDGHDITAEQAISCLSLYAEMAELMGPQVWHDAIIRGNISMLLAAIEGSSS